MDSDKVKFMTGSNLACLSKVKPANPMAAAFLAVLKNADLAEVSRWQWTSDWARGGTSPSRCGRFTVSLTGAAFSTLGASPGSLMAQRGSLSALLL